MLNLNQAGGASEALNYSALLASIPTVSKSSGPENPSLLFVYANESGIEEAVKKQKDDSLAWAAKNFSTLFREFQGKWILIKHHHVIASAIEPTDLLRQAIAMGIEKPLMLNVEPSTAAPRDAFAAC